MDFITPIAQWMRETARSQAWLNSANPVIERAPDWVLAALPPATTVGLLLIVVLFLTRRGNVARKGSSRRRVQQGKALEPKKGGGQAPGALRFFISRAGADKDVALAIKAMLNAAGHNATTQEDFRGSFIEGMHASLAKDFYVIALLSNAYLRSSHCSAEWQQPLASDPLNSRGRLVVFRLEHVEPEGLLAPLIYTDLTAVVGDRDRLRDAILDGLPTRRDDGEIVLTPLRERGKRASYAPVLRDSINAAIALLNEGAWSKAKVAFEGTLKTSQELGDEVAGTDIKCSLALIEVRGENDLPTAERLLNECMEALSRKGSDPLRADVLRAMSMLHDARGDLERAEAVQRQELAIRHRLSDKVGEADALIGLAWTVGRNGNTAEAADLNKAAYALAIEGLQGEREQDGITHAQGLMANLFFQRAKLCQRAADPEGAFRALSQALDWQRKNPPNHELAKLLREMGDLRLFRRELTEGLQLISEAAQIYADRELWRDLAECLEIMGRVHASADKRDSAKKLFEESARVALRSSEPGLAATALQDLAQLASEDGDSENAKAHLEEARRISPDPEVQAECLMRLASMAQREGDKDRREELISEAIEILRTDLERAGMPDMDRADKLFTVGWHHRELGQLEEALAAVERAKRIFEGAGALSGIAKASFETAGILDRLGRKPEARETCETLRKLVANTPLFDIRAGVEIALARFAESDGDLESAETIAERAVELCREHELPMMSDALLTLDRLRANRRGRNVAALRLEDLIADYRKEWLKCPSNKDGFTRFWMFSHAADVGAALRGTVGPNLLVVTESLDWFVEASTRLHAYREWSLLATLEEFPERVMEAIPLAGDMIVPPNVGLLTSKGGGDSKESTGDGLIAGMDHATRTLVGLAARGQGGAIPRYHLISLEKPHEHGGATHGIYGPSLGLPPSIFRLLDVSNDEMLRTLRLFFSYYNRDAAEPDKRLWFDVMIANDFRMIPIYRNQMPDSKNVSLLGRCSISLPAFLGEPDSHVRKSVRPVRQALLSLFSGPENNARLALASLQAVADDLVAEFPDSDLTKIECMLLAFQRDEERYTQPAFVMSDLALPARPRSA